MSSAISIEIRKISAAETIDLRSRILRPGQPIEICNYPGDDLPSTFHLGAIKNNKVICNGTFMQEGHLKFSEAKLPYRLRGMATDTEFQGQGLGVQLVTEAISELEKCNCDLLWFNARTTAEKFYRKLGFVAFDEIFDIPLAGPHKVMYKWLKSQ